MSDSFRWRVLVGLAVHTLLAYRAGAAGADQQSQAFFRLTSNKSTSVS
jgi:hypothetical protein